MEGMQEEMEEERDKRKERETRERIHYLVALKLTTSLALFALLCNTCCLLLLLTVSVGG